jgi:hypothetical protein
MMEIANSDQSKQQMKLDYQNAVEQLRCQASGLSSSQFAAHLILQELATVL